MLKKDFSRDSWNRRPIIKLETRVKKITLKLYSQSKNGVKGFLRFIPLLKGPLSLLIVYVSWNARGIRSWEVLPFTIRNTTYSIFSLLTSKVCDTFNNFLCFLYGLPLLIEVFLYIVVCPILCHYLLSNFPLSYFGSP